MIDNPDRAKRLLARMQEALPLPSRVTPEIAAALKAPVTSEIRITFAEW